MSDAVYNSAGEKLAGWEVSYLLPDSANEWEATSLYAIRDLPAAIDDANSLTRTGLRARVRPVWKGADGELVTR